MKTLHQRLDGIFSLSPLQRQVFDAACDCTTFTEEELAQLIEDCKKLNAIECRESLAAFKMD